MSCESIMTADPPVLRTDTPLDDAMGALIRNRAFSLPVVDADGRFVGLFDLRQLMKLLLPKAVTIELGLRHLNYVMDTAATWDHLKKRLAEIGDVPITDFLTTDTPVTHPDTPTMEALRNLYLHPDLVPVVERESGRLVGVVSGWDVFSRVHDAP